MVTFKHISKLCFSFSGVLQVSQQSHLPTSCPFVLRRLGTEVLEVLVVRAANLRLRCRRSSHGSWGTVLEHREARISLGSHQRRQRNRYQGSISQFWFWTLGSNLCSAFHLNFTLFNIFLSSWKLVYVPCSQFTGINFNMIWELVLREGLYIAVTFRVWLVSCVAFFGFRETAMDLTFGMFFFIIFPPTKCFTLRRILVNTFKKLSSSLGCSVPLLVLRNVEGHVQLAHRGHGPVRHQLRSPRRTKDLVLRTPSVRTSAWKSCARHLPKCRFLVTLTLVLFYF